MLDPISCLAAVIYFEARNQSEIGQAAVAHVALNRVASARYPNDVCGVVKQNRRPGTRLCQFSFWCDGKSDKPGNPHIYIQSVLIALAVVDGEIADPTGGAMWYHADYVKPSWRLTFKRTRCIEQHCFYKEK